MSKPTVDDVLKAFQQQHPSREQIANWQKSIVETSVVNPWRYVVAGIVAGFLMGLVTYRISEQRTEPDFASTIVQYNVRHL